MHLPTRIGFRRGFKPYIDIVYWLVVVVVDSCAQSSCYLTRLDLGEITGRGRVGVVRQLDNVLLLPKTGRFDYIDGCVGKTNKTFCRGRTKY